jgi:NAD(P)-dependent dehydrogenase (short-subunit alcohol dehydrogenase family)
MGNPAGLDVEQINRHITFTRQPIQRIASADEVANVCLFLASDESSYVTGADLPVDGGMTLGPYVEFLPGAPPQQTGD